MQGLLNVLDIAREEKLQKVYGQAALQFSDPLLPNKIARSKPL